MGATMRCALLMFIRWPQWPWLALLCAQGLCNRHAAHVLSSAPAPTPPPPAGVVHAQLLLSPDAVSNSTTSVGITSFTFDWHTDAESAPVWVRACVRASVHTSAADATGETPPAAQDFLRRGHVASRDTAPAQRTTHRQPPSITAATPRATESGCLLRIIRRDLLLFDSGSLAFG